MAQFILGVLWWVILSIQRINMDNKIPFSSLIVILELDGKETKVHRFYQEKDFLLQRKEFQQAVNSIRLKKNIDFKYFNTLISKYKKQPRLVKSGELSKVTKRRLSEIRSYINERLDLNDIAHLRIVCGLSKAWEHSLIKYVLTNQMSKPNFLPKVKLIDAPNRCDRKISIEIYGNNCWRDVKNIWNTLIEPRLKLLPDYSIKGAQYKPNLVRDSQIYKWWKSNIRGKELEEKVDKKYLDFVYIPDTLRKIIERMKKEDSKRRIV